MKRIIQTIGITFCLHLASFAAVPLRWTVETSRVQPVAFDAVHGESIALEAAFKSYGTDVQLPATAALYYQTNGMGSAWWTIPATVSSNRVTAVFAPTNDPGASSVSGFIGTPGEIFRAAFTLRFRKGPGASPNPLELPTSTIDCATVTFLNPSSAPWSGGGSGGTDGAAVTNIVDGIVASSNLCTVAAARAMVPTKWAFANVTNASGEAVTASDVGALPATAQGEGTPVYSVSNYAEVRHLMMLGGYFSIKGDSNEEVGYLSLMDNKAYVWFLKNTSTMKGVYYGTDTSAENEVATLGDIPAVPTAWPATSITNATGGTAIDYSTNNAALVATVTNLAPASAKSVTPHDPVLDCDWVLNVTNGVFFWTVKE